MRIIVHNCRTQHSMEQFWLSSLLTSRQASQLRYCLLEGRGGRHTDGRRHKTFHLAMPNARCNDNASVVTDYKDRVRRGWQAWEKWAWNAGWTLRGRRCLSFTHSDGLPSPWRNWLHFVFALAGRKVTHRRNTGQNFTIYRTYFTLKLSTIITLISKYVDIKAVTCRGRVVDLVSTTFFVRDMLQTQNSAD